MERRFYAAPTSDPGLIRRKTTVPCVCEAWPCREEPFMSHACLRIIHNEHAGLAAMLHSLASLLDEHRRKGTLPDFSVLRAMLFYVDEFPEKLHHTKESDLLFPKMRARCPEAAVVLDQLESDHARGEQAIRDLQHDLLAFEVLGEPRREAFEQAVQRYIAFYLTHMAVEEREILPLAQREFSAADWAELDAAFLANRDPLTGHEPDDVWRPLFSKIVNAVPAPIGLGPALR